VAVGWDANRIAFWDQQRGIGWDYDADQFRRPGDGGSSGYAYVATYQPAELEPEPEPDQEADPVPLTMYLGPAPNLTQRDIDNTLFELTNIYHRMEKVPESPRKKQAELGIIAVKRALTGIE
jgi:hypothetical protein